MNISGKGSRQLLSVFRVYQKELNHRISQVILADSFYFSILKIIDAKLRYNSEKYILVDNQLGNNLSEIFYC